jgi:DNA topoisomerase-1
VRKSVEMPAVLDGTDAAEAAGLVYASSDTTGLTRQRRGRGFVYRDAAGKSVVDPTVLERIGRLVIPPAWRDVWICANPAGHIQAVGFDERGRKQYRYHEQFRAMRDEAKFEHVIRFAEALPRLRRRVATDMSSRGLGREKVLATIVQLLETTLIRIGNTAYAQENGSYGLTTLLARHATLAGSELRLHFKGKSGRIWRLSVSDRRIAKVVKPCQELPGQHLFQYLDEAGERQAVTSADVNAYLRDAARADVTTKDFRTWAGTVVAAKVLAARSSDASPSKSAVAKAIAEAADRLGNTVAVCRKCYVHPDVLAAYMSGELALPKARRNPAFDPVEAGVLALLRSRASANGADVADAERRRPWLSTRSERPQRSPPPPAREAVAPRSSTRRHRGQHRSASS